MVILEWCRHTLQGRSEEIHVSLLIGSNLLNVGVEGIVHASLDKVFLGIVLKTLSVKVASRCSRVRA
jgi:hypothetical protein